MTTTGARMTTTCNDQYSAAARARVSRIRRARNMHVEHCAIFIVAALITTSNAALITGLPGAPTVSYKQYSGYLAAGNNRFLHYWFSRHPIFRRIQQYAMFTIQVYGIAAQSVNGSVNRLAKRGTWLFIGRWILNRTRSFAGRYLSAYWILM